MKFLKVLNVGYFLFRVYLDVNKARYFSVNRFRILKRLTGIPSCVVHVCDSEVTLKNNAVSLPRITQKVNTLKETVKKALLNKTLLLMLLVLYKVNPSTGNTDEKIWFNGRICSIEISSAVSINKAKTTLVCNCLNKVCLLSYNYITLSTFLPGDVSISTGVIGDLKSIAAEGYRKPALFLMPPLDYRGIMKNSNASLATDTVLLFTNKCVALLFKSREDKYKTLFKSTIPITVPNVDLEDYFDTKYKVSSLIYPPRQTGNTNISIGQVALLDHFLDIIANGVVSMDIASAMFAIFSRLTFLTLAPSIIDGTLKLLIIPGSFVIEDFVDRLYLTLDCIKAGALSHEPMGELHKPLCLVALYLVAQLFEMNELANALSDVVSLFGVFPKEARNQANTTGKKLQRLITFIKGPRWIADVASRVALNNLNGSAFNPRVRQPTIASAADVLDAFTKLIYKSLFSSSVTAGILLIPYLDMFPFLYSKIGRLIHFQLPLSTSKQAIDNTQSNIALYSGILGKINIYYENGGDSKSTFSVNALIYRVTLMGSKNLNLLYDKNDFLLYET